MLYHLIHIFCNGGKKRDKLQSRFAGTIVDLQQCNLCVHTNVSSQLRADHLMLCGSA